MKKLFLAIALFLGVSFAASAEQNAIGLRFGSGGEVSYLRTLSNSNRLEADLGIGWWYGLNLTGVYQWTWDIPKVSGLGWYAGVGANVGFDFFYGANSFTFGPTGQVGIEYKFKFPLQLSFDYRPSLKMYVGHNFGVYPSGFYDFAFSARYCF